jgi:hypothetical protein
LRKVRIYRHRRTRCVLIHSPHFLRTEAESTIDAPRVESPIAASPILNAAMAPTLLKALVHLLEAPAARQGVLANCLKPTNHMRPSRRRRFYLAVLVDPRDTLGDPMPDRHWPVKARAARARLRRLAALTGQRRPGPPASKRSRRSVSAIAPVATLAWRPQRSMARASAILLAQVP